MTCNSVIGFAPVELMMGHFPLMPVEEDVKSWRTIGWCDQISQDELFSMRIEHLSQTPERVTQALEKIKIARLKNKNYFDRMHQRWPREIK